MRLSTDSSGRVRRVRGETPRGRTISAKQMRASVRAFAEQLDVDDLVELDAQRPRVRGDCLPGGCNEARPCPFVGCKYHTYLEVNPETGAIKLNHAHLEVDQLAESCALDRADRGEATLEETGQILNLTRERTRQIEVRAFHQAQQTDDVDIDVDELRELAIAAGDR